MLPSVLPLPGPDRLYRAGNRSFKIGQSIAPSMHDYVSPDARFVQAMTPSARFLHALTPTGGSEMTVAQRYATGEGGLTEQTDRTLFNSPNRMGSMLSTAQFGDPNAAQAGVQQPMQPPQTQAMPWNAPRPGYMAFNRPVQSLSNPTAAPTSGSTTLY